MSDAPPAIEAVHDTPPAAKTVSDVPPAAESAQPSQAPKLLTPPVTPAGIQQEFMAPRKGTPRCGLVWMHGLGDNNTAWTDLVDDLTIARNAGPCKFIFPQAPLQKVSAHNDRFTSWFDMEFLPVNTLYPPPHGCSLDEALQTCGRVHAAVSQIIALGVPPSRIILGGFSQGAAMALLAAITFSSRLGGVIMFSGIAFFCNRFHELIQPHARGLEVFWGHGVADTTLDISLQQDGVEALQEAGFVVTIKQYEFSHSADPTQKEEADASEFINRLLA